MKKYVFILIILISGCGTTLTGYHFETTAIYQASLSKLQVNLKATGNVPAGEDIGSGEASGTIIGSQFSDTIYFHISNLKVIALKFGQENIGIKNPEDISETLMSCFDKIGYKRYNQKEIEELGEVMNASTFGPKGTYLDEQTELIKVLSVEFKRK